jgi:hypothetical protein
VQRAESREGRENREAIKQPFATSGTIWLRKRSEKREENGER